MHASLFTRVFALYKGVAVHFMVEKNQFYFQMVEIPQIKPLISSI